MFQFSSIDLFNTIQYTLQYNSYSLQYNTLHRSHSCIYVLYDNILCVGFIFMCVWFRMSSFLTSWKSLTFLGIMGYVFCHYMCTHYSGFSKEESWNNHFSLAELAKWRAGDSHSSRHCAVFMWKGIFCFIHLILKNKILDILSVVLL